MADSKARHFPSQFPTGVFSGHPCTALLEDPDNVVEALMEYAQQQVKGPKFADTAQSLSTSITQIATIQMHAYALARTDG